MFLTVILVIYFLSRNDLEDFLAFAIFWAILLISIYTARTKQKNIKSIKQDD